MDEIGGRRFFPYAVAILSIAFVALMLGLSLYWAKFEEEKTAGDGKTTSGGESPARFTNETTEALSAEPPMPAPEEQTTAEGRLFVERIRRIRLALSKRLSMVESSRFRDVFDSVELAADENRIDEEHFGLFPDKLKKALADGNISDSELDDILDILERSVISPCGQ